MNPDGRLWRDITDKPSRKVSPDMDLLTLLRALGLELEHAPPASLGRQRDRLVRAIDARR